MSSCQLKTAEGCLTVCSGSGETGRRGIRDWDGSGRERESTKVVSVPSLLLASHIYLILGVRCCQSDWRTRYNYTVEAPSELVWWQWWVCNVLLYYDGESGRRRETRMGPVRSTFAAILPPLMTVLCLTVDSVEWLSNYCLFSTWTMELLSWIRAGDLFWETFIDDVGSRGRSLFMLSVYYFLTTNSKFLKIMIDRLHFLFM